MIGATNHFSTPLQENECRESCSGCCPGPSHYVDPVRPPPCLFWHVYWPSAHLPPIFWLKRPFSLWNGLFWDARTPFCLFRPCLCLRRPLLAITCPFFGHTDLSVPFLPRFWTRRPLPALIVPFWTHRPLPAPFLDTPTTSCPVLGRADLSLLDFGLADPFLPRFWTCRPLLARNRPSLDPSLLNLDTPTLSCPEPSFFGRAVDEKMFSPGFRQM